MKINIAKSIIQGKYHVFVSVGEFTIEERQKMDKFGVPMINIRPLTVFKQGRFIEILPLNQINHDFQFSDTVAANVFAESIQKRITITVNILKKREDKFSSSNEYEV